MVGIWQTGSPGAHSYHAVYIENIDSNGLFHCINSWGTKDPRPKLNRKDLTELHYVSLYTDDPLPDIVYLSASASSWIWNHLIGLYVATSKESDGVSVYK